MFGAFRSIRNVIFKTNIIYHDYETAFDRTNIWCFNNDFAQNVAIFGFDRSSSIHSNSYKNKFSVLCERNTDDINGSVTPAKKMFNLSFSESKAKFCLSLY